MKYGSICSLVICGLLIGGVIMPVSAIDHFQMNEPVILYEIFVRDFGENGTFADVERKLDELQELGSIIEVTTDIILPATRTEEQELILDLPAVRLLSHINYLDLITAR